MRKKAHACCVYVPPNPSARERDYDLAYRAARGDEAAWDTLYQEAVGRVTVAVRRAGTRHILPDSDCPDIVDEAFARCYEQLHRYQGLSRFYYWVFGYARNIMGNRLRAQRTRQRNQYLLACAAAENSYYTDPLRVLLRLERDQCLWKAVSLLQRADRNILLRRVLFRTAFRTLARETSLTQRQVRQHYQNALDAVRWNFRRFYRTASGG